MGLWEEFSPTLTEFRILGVPVKKPEEIITGAALGTGINLAWAFGGTGLQGLDPGFLEHYHAGLALLILDKSPFTQGLAATLIGADILTSNPFGANDPVPEKSINFAVGAIEAGILIGQLLSGWKK